MHPVDIAVIIAESLPERQAVDWMLWWCPQQSSLVFQHPSLHWWIFRHAQCISAVVYNRNKERNYARR